jgi:FtsP/CotA-like multicopper oxidase with cupredoxin domain
MFSIRRGDIPMTKSFSRRDFLRAGGLTLLGAASVSTLAQTSKRAGATPPPQSDHEGMTDIGHDMATTVGEVDHTRNGFNPTDMLTDFDYGRVSTLENGQTLREYDFVAVEKVFELAPGIEFPGWAYNGRIPGPTIRCTEGDRICINFTNGSSHPHTMHFHGIHPFEMDGVPGAGPGNIMPGQSFTYEFEAEPFGLHLYHCHTFPWPGTLPKGYTGLSLLTPRQAARR